MATPTKSKIRQPTGTRYKDDLYTWVAEQVTLLRAGRVSEIDALNIAEELADVGKSELNALRSAIAVLTQHLLKWDQQPERRSRSWLASINEQRRSVSRVLKENPALKSKLTAVLSEGYADGRDRAVADTNLDYAVFPEACPYTFDEMMTRVIELRAEPKSRKR
jgi:Domain of unknown function DUF29